MSGPVPSPASPSDELARLRAELAQEEAQLSQLEEGVEMRAAQLSYLNAEYIANASRVRYYYEPKLRPLRGVTHAAEEKKKFIETQITWLEKKIALQDKCATEHGMFLEVRDMKPTADAMMKTARQSLLQAYQEIQNCPADTLRILVNYENPPDAALETMLMVLRLRGEADLTGPILPADEDATSAANQGNSASTTANGALAVNATKALPATGNNSAAAAAAAPVKKVAERSEEEARQRRLWAASAAWPHAKVLVSHNYFTNFFEPRSEGMLNTKDVLDDELMLALEAFCENVDHTVENLYQCSTPVGCLGQWLHAVRDIYRVRLVTAPVLLKAGSEICSAAGLRRVRRLLAQTTFGRPTSSSSDDDEDAHDENKKGTETVPQTAADGSTTQDADAATKKMTILGEAPTTAERKSGSGALIQVDADLLAKYQESKKRLAALTRPSAVGQKAVYRLRHRLCQLDESCVEAREQVAELEAEMAEKLAEVRRNYDDSMLPLHDQLETQTKEFLTALTGEENVVA